MSWFEILKYNPYGLIGGDYKTRWGTSQKPPPWTTASSNWDEEWKPAVIKYLDDNSPERDVHYGEFIDKARQHLELGQTVEVIKNLVRTDFYKNWENYV